MHAISPSPRTLALALVALSFSLPQGAAAQAARTSSGSRGTVHPRSIETVAPAHPLVFSERHTVWFQVPANAGAPLDLELRAEPRPALLEVAVYPPVCEAAAPGALARFTVTLRGRPSFEEASFALVFRERASGVALGEIPVGIERGVGAGPRATKEAALQTLSELRDALAAGEFDVGHREEALAKLDHALEELGESLAPELWLRDELGNIDPERLDPEEGHHVFHEERECAQKVFDAIRQGEIADAGLTADLLAVIDALVAADRRLAEVAIQDALDGGGDGQEIDEALDGFGQGDELVDAAGQATDLLVVAALLYTAVDGAYRHAWADAIEALRDD